MNGPEKNLIPRSLFRTPSFFPSLWEDVEGRLGQWMGREEANTGVSVSEDDSHVYVEAQLPGLTADNLDISLNKNTLWIKGEKEEKEEKGKKYYRRARSSFFYQVELPSQIDEGSEHADFENGVLKVTFAKTRQSQVKKIAVKGNKGQEKKESNKK